MTVLPVVTAREQLFFASLRVLVERSDGMHVGTSVVVSHPVTDESKGDFLVTNRHVLEGAERIQVEILQGTDAGPELGKTVNISLESVDGRWSPHPDPSIDVAVLPLGFLDDEFSRRRISPFLRSIPYEMMATEGQLSEMGPLADVLVVGYPLGMCDEANRTPIGRGGKVASLPGSDFERLPQILIDAPIYPGSSGSPVYFETGGYTPGKGFRLGSQLFLVGLVSHWYASTPSGAMAAVPIPTRSDFILDSRDATHLGLALKAKTIGETITGHIRRIHSEGGRA